MGPNEGPVAVLVCSSARTAVNAGIRFGPVARRRASSQQAHVRAFCLPTLHEATAGPGATPKAPIAREHSWPENDHQGPSPRNRQTIVEQRDQAQTTPNRQTIELPTEDGQIVLIREPVKTVRQGARTVTLRKPTPEEKQRRRAISSVVFFVAGVLLLGGTVMLLRWATL